MNLDPATKIALEAVYRILLGAIVQLAAVLGKPCPVVTRAERHHDHTSHAPLAK